MVGALPVVIVSGVPVVAGCIQQRISRIGRRVRAVGGDAVAVGVGAGYVRLVAILRARGDSDRSSPQRKRFAAQIEADDVLLLARTLLRPVSRLHIRQSSGIDRNLTDDIQGHATRSLSSRA